MWPQDPTAKHCAGMLGCDEQQFIDELVTRNVQVVSRELDVYQYADTSYREQYEALATES